MSYDASPHLTKYLAISNRFLYLGGYVETTFFLVWEVRKQNID